MMEKFAKILYKCRFFFLFIIIIVTIMFASSIETKIDNSIKAWFSSNDPNYIVYENFRDTFEGNRFLIVALRADNIFSLNTLQYIKQKTEELEDLDQVKQVHSLANANKIIGTPEGIEINPLLAGLETDNLEKIKKHALDDELFRNYLVSSDGKFTAIMITFDELSSEQTKTIFSQVKEIVYKEKPGDLELYFSGDVRIALEFDKYTKQNQRVFSILILSLIAIFIFILFHSLFKTLLILAVAGISLVWTLGFYSLLGYTVNVVTGMLVPLVLILSIADSIHIMEYFKEMRIKYDKKEAFITTLSYITVPCFITSITTAFGLLSLATSPISAVKNFAVGSSAGIMFAFFIAIVLVPLFLTLLPAKKQKIKATSGWTLFLNRISAINRKGFKYILLIITFCFIFFGLGISKLKIETDEMKWFPKRSDTYISSMMIDKNLAGIGSMDVLIQGTEGILKEPHILKQIDELSLKIAKFSHVKKVISLADYVKRINKSLREDNPDYYTIPAEKSLIAQELFLFTLSDDGREELESVATSDYSQGRISIKIEYIKSEEMVVLGNSIKKIAEETFSGTDINVSVTGPSYLYSLLDDYLLKSQIKGFSLAFLLVVAILFISFGSLRYGFLSIFPNLVPIVFIIGIMGWCGISLNVGTVMIASVALGIAVDDTIHFISRFRKELKNNKLPIKDILSKTTVATGRAIISTSVINIMGFLVLFASDFQPTREFGALVALTLFFALIGDIILLPSMLMLVRKFLTRKKA